MTDLKEKLIALAVVVFCVGVLFNLLLWCIFTLPSVMVQGLIVTAFIWVIGYIRTNNAEWYMKYVEE
jgi:hypothetical protein